MNHGGMDHGGMDHGGMGHGGMDHGDMGGCSMNMVWNWETRNLCVLTSAWRITTPLSLYVSLGLIVLAGVMYEWLRLSIRRFDARLLRSMPVSPAHRRRASLRLPTTNPASSTAAIALPRSLAKCRSTSTPFGARDDDDRRGWIVPLETSRRTQLIRSTLYALSVAISFLLMLVAMTFNAYIIAAIVIGAGVGNYLFNRELSSSNALLAASADDTGLACHM